MRAARANRMGRLLLLTATGLVLAACAPPKPPPADQMVSIGSHRLQLHQEGEGKPVVVLDAGITDQFDKMKPLQQRLARVTRVISYNRAGYGLSDPGPLPRDGAREAEELKTLLERASIPGPYVLVGHSLGALNVEFFAARYPEAVAGMVLLDPPPRSFIMGQEYGELSTMAEQMTAQWQGIADSAAASGRPEDRAKAAFFGAIASEHRALFGETARMVDSITSFGDIPLVVIAAGKPNPAFGAVAEPFQQYWIEQSRALSGMSTRGRFVLAEGSSHYIYLDAPDLVEQAVLSVVEQARGK
jgi:pimeloyl-ACP methyl ester carboxylesterase